MQAYDLYLKARDLLSRPPGEEGRQWKKADDLVDSAIARDPKFTLAYCLKSEVEILLYRYFDHTPGRLAGAKEAATRASQLAPTLGEPHLALAQYYYHGFRDYTRTQNELKLAAPTMSGKAEFLSIAEVTERRLGHWKDALRDGEKAMALDPQDPVYATTLMESYIILRMFSEAERVADVAIAQLPGDSASLVWADKADAAIGAGKLDHAQEIIIAAPQNASWKNTMLSMVAFCKRDYTKAAQLLEEAKPGQSKDYWDHVLEGKIRRKLEEPEKARAAFEQAKDLIEGQLRTRPDDSTLLGFLAVSYAGLGRKDDAIATARKATLLLPFLQDPIDGPNCVSMLAEVYATTGEPEAALNELSKIVRLPSGAPPGDLRLNPVWDSLRNDARFSELLVQAEKPLNFF
jgi:tetratricopeptide (TPR) repeat protein